MKKEEVEVIAKALTSSKNEVKKLILFCEKTGERPAAKEYYEKELLPEIEAALLIITPLYYAS